MGLSGLKMCAWIPPNSRSSGPRYPRAHNLKQVIHLEIAIGPGQTQRGMPVKGPNGATWAQPMTNQAGPNTAQSWLDLTLLRRLFFFFFLVAWIPEVVLKTMKMKLMLIKC